MIKLTRTESLILQAVVASPCDLNGSTIAKAADVKRNTVYALLQRLEHKGAVMSYQRHVEGEHVLQRFYGVTDAGRESCPLPLSQLEQVVKDMVFACSCLHMVRENRGKVETAQLNKSISIARNALQAGIKALEHAR